VAAIKVGRGKQGPCIDIGDPMRLTDLLAASHDPFERVHMRETVENLAVSHRIIRGD
jgi:hypothetical protein